MWKGPQILKNVCADIRRRRERISYIHAIRIETWIEWINMHTVTLNATYHYKNVENAYNNVSNDQTLM